MYKEYYSTFPVEIDRFKSKQDVGYNQLADVRRYQELKTKSTLTEPEMAELNQLIVKLQDYIWFAEDLNKVGASLENLQVFFRDNTTTQLQQYKEELKQFSDNYQQLTQQFAQSWTTTASKIYDIHSGNETLATSVELKVDSSANIEVTIDGVQVAYDKYTIGTNASGKKTTITFASDYAIVAGKRLEARWFFSIGKEFVVGNHQHSKTDIMDSPTVAKTGRYGDLTEIPTEFPPSTHKHVWGGIDEKPTTYPPSGHYHDDRYYTETEMNTKLDGKSNTGHKHAIADVTGLQGEIDSLKSSVSSGKTQVASAITAKGVSASGSDSFPTLASKIGQIETSNVPEFGDVKVIFNKTDSTSVTFNPPNNRSGMLIMWTTYNTSNISVACDNQTYKCFRVRGNSDKFNVGLSQFVPRIIFYSGLTPLVFTIDSGASQTFYAAYRECAYNFSVESRQGHYSYCSKDRKYLLLDTGYMPPKSFSFVNDARFGGQYGTGIHQVYENVPEGAIGGTYIGQYPPTLSNNVYNYYSSSPRYVDIDNFISYSRRNIYAAVGTQTESESATVNVVMCKPR